MTQIQEKELRWLCGDHDNVNYRPLCTERKLNQATICSHPSQCFSRIQTFHRLSSPMTQCGRDIKVYLYLGETGSLCLSCLPLFKGFLMAFLNRLWRAQQCRMLTPNPFSLFLLLGLDLLEVRELFQPSLARSILFSFEQASPLIKS